MTRVEYEHINALVDSYRTLDNAIKRMKNMKDRANGNGIKVMLYSTLDGRYEGFSLEESAELLPMIDEWTGNKIATLKEKMDKISILTQTGGEDE